MKSENKILINEKIQNNNIPSKQIVFNIPNKKNKNKLLFLCFIVDKNYKDKIDISLNYKNDIIKPKSIIIKYYDFIKKNFFFH